VSKIRKATQAVLDFMEGVDLKQWRANLPITGDTEKDIAALTEAFGRFALQGVRSSFSSDQNEAKCAALAGSLVGLFPWEFVDWYQVLQKIDGNTERLT